MQLHASCPESWWEFSFETAIHVYNRTPLRQTNWSTPYENIFGKKPDVHYFKTFGCLAWVYTPKESRKNKLVPRSEQMTFIGYDMGAKAYKFMCKDNSMVIAMKCLFDKDTFPRAKSENGTSNQNKLIISPPGNKEDLEEIYIPPNPKINDIDCYNMVWTPTLCIPDTSDRHCYFLSNYLI